MFLSVKNNRTNLDKSAVLLYNFIIASNFGNGKVFDMSSLKKNDTGISGFIQNLPFFKKEEKAWDDAIENDADGLNEKRRVHMISLMSIYGAVTGFFGCQYCKYLHQRFACYAWGVEFTSRPIKSYGLPSILIDIMSVFGVYVFLGTIGLLLNRILRAVFAGNKLRQKEMFDEALGYGFLFMILVSMIMLFVPFNVFLIGVD